MHIGCGIIKSINLYVKCYDYYFFVSRWDKNEYMLKQSDVQGQCTNIHVSRNNKVDER